MDGQMGIPASNFEPAAARQPAQRPLDENVGAAVEAEVLKVDSRAQR